MNISIDDKAKNYIKKQGAQDIHVYLKGCSS